VTEGQLVTTPVSTPWRSVVEDCALAVGRLDPSVLSAWRRELDDAQRRVAALRGDVPGGCGVEDPLPVGVHALLTLAGARLGVRWRPGQLVDAAAAAELAHRAVLQHEAVRDRPASVVRAAAVAPINKGHVLGGDWSITQAARLVADIGPAAYRVLVRGWGAAQLTRLRTGVPSERDALFATAISLGALTAGIPEESVPRLCAQGGLPSLLLDWAGRF
jgi:hypothetical protein